MEKYYKGKFMIAWYTKPEEGEELVGLFDNMDQISKFLGLDRSSKEFKTLKSRISSATKKNCTLNTRYMMFNGYLARPYLIYADETETDEEILL